MNIKKLFNVVVAFLIVSGWASSRRAQKSRLNRAGKAHRRGGKLCAGTRCF
jgi:hypothetical protein